MKVKLASMALMGYNSQKNMILNIEFILLIYYLICKRYYL